jgi:hypothetical protein
MESKAQTRLNEISESFHQSSQDFQSQEYGVTQKQTVRASNEFKVENDEN